MDFEIIFCIIFLVILFILLVVLVIDVIRSLINDREKKICVDNDGYTIEEKTSYWRIVRYKNGHFDVIWKYSIYDKRVADKKCRDLNDPQHGNEWRYGTYVVEK